MMTLQNEIYFFNQVCAHISCFNKLFNKSPGLKKFPFSILIAAGLLHPSQVLWLSLITHQEHCGYKLSQVDQGNHTKS